MVRLFADQNFNNDIVTGVLLLNPKVEFSRAQDAGLSEAEDPDLLEWAANNECIVVTHDRATMPDFAYERLLAGKPLPGVFVINDRLPVRQAIEELLLIWECSDPSDWVGRVVHLPI